MTEAVSVAERWLGVQGTGRHGAGRWARSRGVGARLVEQGARGARRRACLGAQAGAAGSWESGRAGVRGTGAWARGAAGAWARRAGDSRCSGGATGACGERGLGAGRAAWPGLCTRCT